MPETLDTLVSDSAGEVLGSNVLLSSVVAVDKGDTVS